MNRYLDLALKITAWSCMLFTYLLMVLKGLGIIHSPTSDLVTGIMATCIFIEIGRLEERSSDIKYIKKDIAEIKGKFNLLWSDFKKRKEI